MKVLNRTVSSCGVVYYDGQVVLTFESVDEILSMTIQMKAIEQYFSVVCLLCCTGDSNF